MQLGITCYERARTIKENMQDPIHKKHDGWYFWDETGTEEIGPYVTEGETRQHLESYCQWLSGEPVGG